MGVIQMGEVRYCSLCDRRHIKDDYLCGRCRAAYEIGGWEAVEPYVPPLNRNKRKKKEINNDT